MGDHHTCCFTGHRPEKLPWGDQEDHPHCVALKENMAAQLEEMYQKGYRHFLCGMARGADFYFAEAVLALKERRPDVLLECARPCESQADRWPEEERARYQSILDRCDYETLVQRQYTPGCMQRRDRYMVEMAQQYPQYEFEHHKGYPTKRHYELLRQYGPCPIHRRSFLKKL